MILDPAKPRPSNSELHKKILVGTGPTDPLPPIDSGKNGLIASKSAKNKEKSGNAVSYQVVFDDDDKLKTKKYSKFSSMKKRDVRLASERIDER